MWILVISYCLIFGDINILFPRFIIWMPRKAPKISTKLRNVLGNVVNVFVCVCVWRDHEFFYKVYIYMEYGSLFAPTLSKNN